MTEKNQAEAARVAGIHLTTLKRWLRLPEFQEEYLQARREVVSQANARIQSNCGAMASLALMLAANKDTPIAVKARLCLGLLDRANNSVELEDVLMRIARLENQQSHRKDPL